LKPLLQLTLQPVLQKPGNIQAGLNFAALSAFGVGNWREVVCTLPRIIFVGLSPTPVSMTPER
jgi:hypothetical protein